MPRFNETYFNKSLMPESQEKKPTLHCSRRTILVTFILLFGVFPAVIPFGMFTSVALSKYRGTSTISFKFARISFIWPALARKWWFAAEPHLHRYTFQVKSHFNCVRRRIILQKFAERRYYLALREDDEWVSIIVHHMVCSEADRENGWFKGKHLYSEWILAACKTCIKRSNSATGPTCAVGFGYLSMDNR